MKFATTIVVVVVMAEAVSSQTFGRQQDMLYDSQDLLLDTLRRTNQFIDHLPDMKNTARQMGALWKIAYPQLKRLLVKSGAWVDQIPVPAGNVVNANADTITPYQGQGDSSIPFSIVSTLNYGKHWKEAMDQSWFPNFLNQFKS